MRNKEIITITKVFKEILDESERTPNKILVDKGSTFSNRLMKSWLQDNDIEMYLTHNEGKSIVAETFKTCKRMTSVSKMCILIN